MDIQAINVIDIIKDNTEAAICQEGTSVAKILEGMEKGAENGTIDDTIATIPLGWKRVLKMVR